MYKRPNEKSKSVKPWPKGIIPQPNKLNINVETGPK